MVSYQYSLCILHYVILMHHATVSFHHKNKQAGLGLYDCPFLDAFAHDKQASAEDPNTKWNFGTCDYCEKKRKNYTDLEC